MFRLNFLLFFILKFFFFNFTFISNITKQKIKNFNKQIKYKYMGSACTKSSES